jgi:hypothetical protein
LIVYSTLCRWYSDGKWHSWIILLWSCYNFSASNVRHYYNSLLYLGNEKYVVWSSRGSLSNRNIGNFLIKQLDSQSREIVSLSSDVL